MRRPVATRRRRGRRAPPPSAPRGRGRTGRDGKRKPRRGRAACLTILLAALRRAITKSIDDHGKRWQHLPPAWVVEVIARKARRPVLEDTRKLSCSDLIAHQVFRHIGDPVASDRSVNHRKGGVK